MKCEDCYTCAYADRSKYGVYEGRCSGYSNCGYDEYTGDVGKRLIKEDLNKLYFGSLIRLDYNNKVSKEYVKFGDKLGAENGTFEKISYVEKLMESCVVKVFLLEGFGYRLYD